MERFPLESADDLAANYARHMALHVWGDDLTDSVAVNICENCRSACDRLTLVPEFDFLGCDTCMEECVAQIAAEARKPVQSAGSLEVREVA